jgi:hypothetical protein
VDFELPPGSEVFGAEAYVFGAGRIHADDTTVEVLAKLKTITGRIWTYVRGDRPFATVVRTTFDDNGLSTVKPRLLLSPSPRVVKRPCQRPTPSRQGNFGLTRKENAMQYATLGNTGLLVSKLCFGTMTFGDGRGLFKAQYQIFRLPTWQSGQKWATRTWLACPLS